jgi:hypothetical protein
VRYEHKAPGDLLHIDTRKLGRIVRPSHRVAGNRRDSVDGAGWETLFVPSMTTQDSRSTPCILTRSRHRQFLRNAVAYCARLGITVRRLLTDNGSAFRSREFRARPSVKQAATPRRTRLARGMHLNRAWCGRPAFRRPSAEDLEATSRATPWSWTATRPGRPASRCGDEQPAHLRDGSSADSASASFFIADASSVPAAPASLSDRPVATSVCAMRPEASSSGTATTVTPLM